MVNATESQPRDYAPLVAECTRRGIGRTKAFELAAAGLLETFSIGRKRFVYIDSLQTLPQRLENGQAKVAA